MSRARHHSRVSPPQCSLLELELSGVVKFESGTSGHLLAIVHEERPPPAQTISAHDSCGVYHLSRESTC
jgi:hypothetical protein